MVDELREMQEMTFVWDEGLGRYREARDYAPEEEIMSMGGSWEDFDEYKKDVKNYGYGYINAIPAAHCVRISCFRQGMRRGHEGAGTGRESRTSPIGKGAHYR